MPQAIDPGVLQLAAATAFFVAAKVEEEDPPTTSELMSLCDHAYDRAKFKHMEFIMLDQVVQQSLPHPDTVQTVKRLPICPRGNLSFIQT